MLILISCYDYSELSFQQGIPFPCDVDPMLDNCVIYRCVWRRHLKGLAQAKIIKKSVILIRVLNMTIWCKHVHRLELQIFIIFVLRIHQLG